MKLITLNKVHYDRDKLTLSDYARITRKTAKEFAEIKGFEFKAENFETKEILKYLKIKGVDPKEKKAKKDLFVLI